MGYFTNLLVQEAVLKSVEGSDSNGKAKVSSLKEIKCKIEFGNSMISGGRGQEVTSSGRLFTEESVKVGDFIEVAQVDYLVHRVNPSYALDGVSVLNEVYFQ